MNNYSQIPYLMKYMGSKRSIVDFVMTSIKSMNIESQWFCDLFAGTTVVGSSLKNRYNLHINDIQNYSAIFAHTYLLNLKELISPTLLDEIKENAQFLVDEFFAKYPDLSFSYSRESSYEEIAHIEKQQKLLINKEFDRGFHLFAKYYAGTYWSLEQCVWIDSIRAIADRYRELPEFFPILSSLIYAMSYTSQGTGHFAQFRDLSPTNIDDILIYRLRDFWAPFERKFKELTESLDESSQFEYRITSLDYLDCLRIVEENSVIYADPPYTSMHYSRFYHVVETLVKYDYPVLQYKGRYRNDRHQSPFSKRTEVVNAFATMFDNVKARNSHIILSYSDNGLISQQGIIDIGKSVFGRDYKHKVFTKGHVHSKMGRVDEKRNLNVNELIIAFKKK